MKDTMTPFQMRMVVEHYAHAAADRVIRRMANNQMKVITLAFERVAGVGADDYGDASFRKAPHELVAEVWPELADAIVYTSIEMWVHDGRPDVWTIVRGAG